MFSFADMTVSYTPGEGYTGTVPGCPVKVRWGKEFVAQLEAKRQAAIANGNVVDKISSSRKGPTKADITELAAKYNPTKMSQEQYDTFLDDMVERGILNKNEIRRLGYNGLIAFGSFAPGGCIISYSMDVKNPAWNPLGTSYSLSDARGNVLAWAKVKSIIEPVSASCAEALSYAKDTTSIFNVMVDVLEAMQSERKG